MKEKRIIMYICNQGLKYGESIIVGLQEVDGSAYVWG